MIYFNRGEAYEALGESELAAADFQRAFAMFAMPSGRPEPKKL
jgi:hypothetical protein